MNDNFKKVIWVAGHFGIIIREHAERLIYNNKYSSISANRTFAKLELMGYLKRIDRGKRKTDGYKLTPTGIKEFRRIYGYDPKVFNSGDKLNHAIQIVNFYCHIKDDMKKRYIIEESRLQSFKVQKSLDFVKEGKKKTVIPDAFGIYKYGEKKGIAFYLEIENSERRANYVAKKTIENYEDYYLSAQWKSEEWQPKERKIFPPVLIVAYSDYKAKEFIRHFQKKRGINLNYYFTDYNSLKEKGISEPIWYNINNERISILK